MPAFTPRKLSLVKTGPGRPNGYSFESDGDRETQAQHPERAAAARQTTRYTANPWDTPGYQAICCRIGCAWQSESCTPDKLEAIRAGRQHEQERRPELHITTVVDSLLASAA